MKTSEQKRQINNVLPSIILLQLCLLLFLFVPPFFKSNPITYTDLNVMLAIFLSLALVLLCAVLCDEDLKEMKGQLKELNQRLDELTNKKEA